MLFDYFLKRQLDWQELEKMSGFKDRTAAWTVTIWERMSRQGFDIRMIEPFDYQRYMEEGESYLRTFFTKDEYDNQVKTTNILEIQSLIPSFLEQIKVEQRRPTLQDIDDMLADDRLVSIVLNAKALNGQSGFNAHCVLVIDREGEDYILHDPGLPPQPYRRVSRRQLWQAMGAEKSVSEVTGVKYRPRPTRADVILAAMHPNYSRAALAKLFKAGLVTHEGKVLKPGDKLLPTTTLQADMTRLQTPTTTAIDLPIIFEDDDVLVINKPAGILTHAQGKFTTEPSVATFIRQRVADMTGERAGIVHRLDRATSGVLVCAKHPRALSSLQKQFAARSVKKTYVAIVKGHLKQKEAIIDMPIERNPRAPATFRVGANGKPAVTHYKVLAESPTASLVELRPQTGRTHQLRVHLAHIGHPIIGDPLYADGRFGDRMYLHAFQLEVTLPFGTEPTTFEAPLPPEFKEYMA